MTGKLLLHKQHAEPPNRACLVPDADRAKRAAGRRAALPCKADSRISSRAATCECWDEIPGLLERLGAPEPVERHGGPDGAKENGANESHRQHNDLQRFHLVRWWRKVLRGRSRRARLAALQASAASRPRRYSDSDSPTALRACALSRNMRCRTIFPAWSVQTLNVSSETSTPLPLPRPNCQPPARTSSRWSINSRSSKRKSTQAPSQPAKACRTPSRPRTPSLLPGASGGPNHSMFSWKGSKATSKSPRCQAS